MSLMESAHPSSQPGTLSCQRRARAARPSSLRVPDEEPDRRQEDADELLVAVVLLSLGGRSLDQHEVGIDNLDLELMPPLGALCRLERGGGTA